jgi:hypothetical protein
MPWVSKTSWVNRLWARAPKAPSPVARLGARHVCRGSAGGQVILGVWLCYSYPDEGCPCLIPRFLGWRPGGSGCVRGARRPVISGGGRWRRTAAGAGSRAAHARSLVIAGTGRGSCGIRAIRGRETEGGSWPRRGWARCGGSWGAVRGSRRSASRSRRSASRSARRGRWRICPAGRGPGKLACTRAGPVAG